MAEELLDNVEPDRRRHGDPDMEAIAAGGAAPIPEVSINRSTVAELERRRILRVQASAMVILAIAAVLTMLYVGKLILVIVLVSILIAFVLAPLVDLLTRFSLPNTPRLPPAPRAVADGPGDPCPRARRRGCSAPAA